MAKTVTTLNSLEREVARRINIALNGEAKTVVEDCLKKHIKEDVLDVYEPKVYTRRGQEVGALEADSSIQSSVRDCTLTVKDVAVPNEQQFEGTQYNNGTNTPLAEMIEYGKVQNVWHSPPDAAYLHPRPFVENTKKEIKGNSAIRKDIKTAIRKQFPD